MDVPRGGSDARQRPHLFDRLTGALALALVASCGSGPVDELRLTPTDWNGVPAQELGAFLGANGTWELELAESPDKAHLVLYYQVWVDGECVHNAPGPGSRSGIAFSDSAELTVGLKDLLEQDPEAAGDGFLVFTSVGGGYSEAIVELPRGKGSTTWVRREPLAGARAGVDVALLNHVVHQEASSIRFDEDGEADAIGDDGTPRPLEGRSGIVVRLRVD